VDKQINPAIVVVALIIVVAIAGFFLFRASTEKPDYPGQGAGHPAAETGMPGGGGKPGGRITPEQAMKMRIPGAYSPSANTGGNAANAGGATSAPQ